MAARVDIGSRNRRETLVPALHRIGGEFFIPQHALDEGHADRPAGGGEQPVYPRRVSHRPVDRGPGLQPCRNSELFVLKPVGEALRQRFRPVDSRASEFLRLKRESAMAEAVITHSPNGRRAFQRPGGAETGASSSWSSIAPSSRGRISTVTSPAGRSIPRGRREFGSVR